MSRTDKTRPYWVKVNEVGQAFHDHRNGVCDLLADPTRMAGGSGCGLQYGGHDREVNGCPHSCWMCAAVEKQEKGPRRTRAKVMLRNWWRDYDGDDDEPALYDALNEDDPHDKDAE